MPIYLTYFIQILLIIHVLKTGRDRYWIWLLLFLPLIGGIAYLVVEIIPEFSSGITGQRTRRPSVRRRQRIYWTRCWMVFSKPIRR